MTWRGVPCSYCGVRPSVNRDHVIPQSLRKKFKSKRVTQLLGREIPVELLGLVPSCFECNHLKGTRKLVPPSWADKIPALKEAIPGHWRVWKGDIREAAFREVHV